MFFKETLTAFKILLFLQEMRLGYNARFFFFKVVPEVGSYDPVTQMHKFFCISLIDIKRR